MRLRDSLLNRIGCHVWKFYSCFFQKRQGILHHEGIGVTTGNVRIAIYSFAVNLRSGRIDPDTSGAALLGNSFRETQ